MKSYILILSNSRFSVNDPLISFISAERQDRIKRYKDDIDKKLSLYAELIIRMAVSQTLKIFPQDIVLDKYRRV